MSALIAIAIALAIVIVVVRCAGALAVRLGEPRIAGEMIGAILIGPTVLGVAVRIRSPTGTVVGHCWQA